MINERDWMKIKMVMEDVFGICAAVYSKDKYIVARIDRDIEVDYFLDVKKKEIVNKFNKMGFGVVEVDGDDNYVFIILKARR